MIIMPLDTGRVGYFAFRPTPAKFHLYEVRTVRVSQTSKEGQHLACEVFLNGNAIVIGRRLCSVICEDKMADAERGNRKIAGDEDCNLFPKGTVISRLN